MTLSNEQYHADPAVSASHLHAIAKSPQHYWSRFLDPQRQPVEPTAAMRLGSLVHCAVLEPEELHKRYAVCLPRNTKAGKEMALELDAKGIEAVTGSDMDLALAMAVSVRSHPVAAELLSVGLAEQSVWWDDAATGLRCKCRPDWINGLTIVDLKTTTDASGDTFARSVAQYRYHVQQAHYLQSHIADRFIFLAVEKHFPYAVGVYELDADAVAVGEQLRQSNLQAIANCKDAQAWPGYTDQIQTLSLPRWAQHTNDTVLSPDDF